MKRGLSTLFGVALVAISSDVSAICGSLPEVSTSPSGSIAAPLDTHVFLSLGASFRTTGIACGQEPSFACTHADLAFEIRRAPAPNAPSTKVPLTKRETSSGLIAFVELVPDEALEPQTTYEVWSVDRNGRAPSHVLGVLSTGTMVDSVAPEWQGILSGVSWRAPRPGMIRLVTECGESRLSLHVHAPSDVATPFAALRAAIWVVKPHETIDYERPPMVLERLVPDGRDLAWIVAGTDEGIDDDLPIIDGKNPWRVGVRIVNLAGHASSPFEVVVAP